MGRNSFGSPLFYVPVILIFSLPRIPDLLRLGGDPLLWLAATAISLGVLFAALWVFQLTFLKRMLAKGRHPFINLAVMATVGLMRGANYGYLTSVFGLHESPNYEWMLTTPAVVVVVLGIVGFQLAGAIAENRELTMGLVAKRRELLESQAELEATADGEQARLRQDALEAIAPKMATLTALLTEPEADRTRIASELQSLAGSTLREHLNNIWLSPKLSDEIRSSRLSLRDFGVLPRFRLRRQLEPTPIAALVFLTAATTMWQWSGWFALLVTLMIVSAYFVVAKLIMALLPDELTIPTWLGLPLIIGFPTLMLSPAGEIALSLLGPNNNGERTLSYMAVFVPMLTLTISSNRHLDFALARYRNELGEVNAVLERDLAITRRRIWLMRRNWHLKLHGEFQGALTAILARLSMHPSHAIDTDLIRRELDLALRALETDSMQPKRLAETIAELRETWHDVVDISSVHSPQVELLVDADDEARQSLAELIREAANNASKHGKASKMHIVLDRPDDHSIRLIAENNGLLVDRNTRGIGTQFYSDLCLSWSLENLPDGSGVVLTADIPVAPLRGNRNIERGVRAARAGKPVQSAKRS
jgi:signal transduction histidine kinase